MQTRAALLLEQPGKWHVADVELGEPGPGEVLVQMVAAGLCHSDDHITSGDLLVTNFPLCGGHEGAGIVRRVGPGVDAVGVGDHIVTSFLPSCGRCRWCATGLQNLCDSGATTLEGKRPGDTFRMTMPSGEGVAKMGLLGTFSEWQVYHESSVIKVRQDVPFTVAAIASCAVPTGWGSSVVAADVQPGDVVVVMGTGGVGMSAVLGAVHAGASHVIAVDPVKFKRDTALAMGATCAFDNMQDATRFARSVTNGQGADSSIVTVGLLDGEAINQAFAAIRKAGTCVVTAQGDTRARGIPGINLFEISMFQKRIQGAIYGMTSPRRAVPWLLDLYAEGRLRLDELVTTEYALDEINDGYADMHAGRNIRGVIRFPD
ncbi:NDMA-dependent alcohol dehydrogenase [Mycobacterium sp. C31M]